MVRIISAANLGLGDYGTPFYDPSVDGVVYDSEIEDLGPQPPQKKRPTAINVGKKKQTKRGL